MSIGKLGLGEVPDQLARVGSRISVVEIEGISSRRLLLEWQKTRILDGRTRMTRRQILAIGRGVAAVESQIEGFGLQISDCIAQGCDAQSTLR